MECGGLTPLFFPCARRVSAFRYLHALGPLGFTTLSYTHSKTVVSSPTPVIAHHARCG